LKRKVLILGGYGNFGGRISNALVQSGIAVIIAGRSLDRAQSKAAELGELADAAQCDVSYSFEPVLEAFNPSVVIHCCGPFQTADYRVAKACISRKIHYIDLADARDFVCGISALDSEAKKQNCCVISGASTVPALSSAVIEHYRKEFSQIESLVYGISPGQKSPRGLATTASILSYLGKAMKPVAGEQKPRYGWQDLYRQHYPMLGKRWMANCDIGDLDLFPTHYGIQQVRFSAGMENSVLHLGIWIVSWLVRFGFVAKLENHSRFLLQMSQWFDRFGSDKGGMHMLMHGKNHQGRPHTRRWFIIAEKGDGPQIPCIPAIILARNLIASDTILPGARPCVGFITLEEYLAELAVHAITVIDTPSSANGAVT